MGKRKKIKFRFKQNLIPRILAAVLVVLMYLFIGEIFSENLQWSSPILAVMPGSFYLILSYIAWKWSKFGGILFAILGIGLAMLNIWRDSSVLAVYILALVTFMIGFLFVKFDDKK